MTKEVSEQAIDEACDWMARLWAETATEADHQAFNDWLSVSPVHESAWHQIQALQNRFIKMPEPKMGSELLRKKSKVSRRQVLVTGGSTLAVGWLTYGGLQWAMLHDDDSLYTHKGTLQQTVLDNGAQLVLNTDSRVTVNKINERNIIQLHQGEIYLSGQSSTAPVSIMTKQGMIESFDTRLVVRQFDDYSQLSVHEGRASFAPNYANIKQVNSGTLVRFNDFNIIQKGVTRLTDLAWLDGKLAVADMTLADFIDELGRYRVGALRVRDEIAQQRVTGVFSIHDTDRVLQQLAEVLPIRVQTVSKYWVNIIPV